MKNENVEHIVKLTIDDRKANVVGPSYVDVMKASLASFG